MAKHYTGTRDEMLNKALDDMRHPMLQEFEYSERKDAIMQRLPLSLWPEFDKRADAEREG